MEATTPDMEFIRVDKDEFKACPDESIDYAVMEKTDSAMVVPMDAGWNDVGSWSSLCSFTCSAKVTRSATRGVDRLGAIIGGIGTCWMRELYRQYSTIRSSI